MRTSSPLAPRPWTVAVALTLALVGAACGSGEGTGGTGDADRTIEIGALDELAYEPETIDVSVGETIRFVVTNAGETDHEFLVGDEDVQAMAEEEMSDSMDHSAAMATLTLAPGETKEATITFEEAGTLEYACHVEGHYEGGMAGTLRIT